MDKTLPPLTQALTGAIGAGISGALIYPLDLLTTRLQTANRDNKSVGLITLLRLILKREGVAGLFRGIVPDTLSTIINNFLFFYAFTFLRTRVVARQALQSNAKGPVVLSAIQEVAIGCAAGLFSKFIVTPLSNITVRAQTEKRRSVAKGKKAAKKIDSDSDDSDDEFSGEVGLMEIARTIHAERGITGFWSGFQSSILLTTNPAITMYCSDLLKQTIIPTQHQAHPTPAQTFLAGALASSMSSFITYPLILSKTLLQYRSPSSGRRAYSSTFDVISKTVRREGVSGLYRGLQSMLLKGFIERGLSLTIKERLELAIILVHRSIMRRGEVRSEL